MTIEERAAKSIIDNNYIPSPSYEGGYIKGATDQQAIDIDKACEVYRNELTEFVRLLNGFGDLHGIDELGEIIAIEGSVNDFRKAMTEQVSPN